MAGDTVDLQDELLDCTPVSAIVYLNIMPCNKNNDIIEHIPKFLPKIYFAIVPNLRNGELSAFSTC